MDKSLDDIINERPSNQRGRGRGGQRRGAPRERARYDDAPRDGVRKSYPAPERSRNIDNDWVHDRYDDEDSDSGLHWREQDSSNIQDRRRPRGPRAERARYSPSPQRAAPFVADSKIRVENVHYELSEQDLKELFERKGPVESVRLMYDKFDRPDGVAFVTFRYPEDAQRAIEDYDGANAYGQPIRLRLLPPPSTVRPRNPFDNVERPSRSLFERVDSAEEVPRGGGRRRARSASPGRLAPDRIDRYAPDRSSRSPIPRRGTPREGGRRPGARGEDVSRGGRRGGRGRDGPGGRQTVGGRPRKTMEELDAEMNDYWGAGAPEKSGERSGPGSRGPQVATTANGQNQMSNTTTTINADDDLDLMVE